MDVAHLRGSLLLLGRAPIEDIVLTQMKQSQCDILSISTHGGRCALMNDMDVIYLDAAKTSSTISPHEPR